MTHSSSPWDRYLNPQETQAYGQLFKLASQSKPGIVTGSEAVQFFASSGVPNEILSDIWETADRDNVGYLTPETFSIALKLIACAQHGQEVADPIISTAVALPQFKGIQTHIAGVTSPRMNSNSTSYDPSSPANTITPAERDKYNNIFRAHQPTNGVLDASRARNVFLKSKLPTETLGQIWALADVRQAGTLTQAEFAIAMHYIAKLMDGTLTTLPSQLPPTVYSSASGPAASTPMLSHQQSPIVRQMSGSTTPMIQQQFTGNRMIMTPPQRAATIDTLGNMAFAGSSETIPRHWDVTATEKTQYDTFFDKIDIQRHGFVQGKEAVEFFKNSQLPDGDLAHIWDLADTSQRGRLSRNEFAVAMHLIHKRLRGETLPPSLPATLVPPSPLPPAPAAPIGMVSSPVNINRSVTNPARSFSNDVFHQPSKVTSLIDEDLLGDFGNNDQLTQETNQVNQLQNQITSLKSATVDVKNQKLTAEQTLEQLAKQKQELQAQMTQVRMAHEAQVKDLNELQEAIRVEEPEWIQTRSDFEAAQQQLTAVQQEIQQLRQKLDTSRAESEECRRRVHQIQEETANLEAQIDGLNGQVKQQNMMLDINRRQVTASEQDREQAKRNLQDAKEVQGITESARDVDLNTAPKNSISSPPRKSTTDFSIDNNDDSSSDDDDDVDNRPNPQSASSPFGAFAAASPASAHVADNNNSTATSSSFFDIFSPHQEQAELQATSQAVQPDGSDPVDFDAVFGDLAGIPSPDENNHSSIPSSPFDIQGSTTPGSAKKHRAPPPPPPPAAKATDTLKEGDDMDDFDAAFSGPLCEAKIPEGHSAASPVTKTAATAKSDFDDFDDAFGVFDDNKATAAATTTTTTTTTSWPSQFGGFDFPDTNPQKTTDADEWDSIFGGSTDKAVPAPAPKAPTQDGSSFGFEDAFGATPFDAKGKSPASNDTSSSKVFTETNIVGDGNKVDELVKMGFEKQVAKDALERYDQDLAKATNFLLDQTN